MDVAEKCVNARTEGMKRLDGLRRTLDAEAADPHPATDWFTERLFLLQSYLTSKWACYEILTLTFHQLVMQGPPDDGSPRLLALRELLRSEKCGVSISAPMKEYHWPVAFSYEVRNTVVHAGGYVDGVEPLFEDVSPRAPFALRESAIAKLRERQSLKSVQPRGKRLTAELQQAKPDLVAYLQDCESKIDNVLVYLMGFARTAVQGVAAARGIV
jgi:hypothetical protein